MRNTTTTTPTNGGSAFPHHQISPKQPTFYDHIKSLRQTSSNISKQFNRIMICGYINQDFCKKINLSDYQKVLKDSIVKQYKGMINGYLYLKGCFYIHFIEATRIQTLNQYLHKFYHTYSKGQFKQFHKEIRIVYQSYQSSQQLFKSWDCDHNQQSGPILIETDKLEEQILQRSIEIYQFFQDGARTKKNNPAHRIGNMILLNNDDMSLLISKESFMSLEEYLQMYIGQIQITKQADLLYPLPPNNFKVLQFIQSSDYKSFV